MQAFISYHCVVHIYIYSHTLIFVAFFFLFIHSKFIYLKQIFSPHLFPTVCTYNSACATGVHIHTQHLLIIFHICKTSPYFSGIWHGSHNYYKMALEVKYNQTSLLCHLFYFLSFILKAGWNTG